MTTTQEPAPRPPVGPALRALRKATGLSLREFSELAGFDHAFVSRVERDVFRPKASWLEVYLETAGEHLRTTTIHNDKPEETPDDDARN